MNADEIVRALRDYARAYNAGTPYDFSPAIAIQAGNEINHLKAEIFGQADLIESLTAQLAAKAEEAEMWHALRADADRIREGLMDKEMRLIAENIRLEAQLAESQRREKAAVEDLMHTIHNCKFSKCCDMAHAINPKHDTCFTCSLWEWRGLQEAKKGETNA